MPVYGGLEPGLDDGSLVGFTVRASTEQGARDYARCAGSRLALARGFRYARPVRVSLTRAVLMWRAEAVYTLSPELPPGVDVVDAEITVLACEAQDIPTD